MAGPLQMIIRMDRPFANDNPNFFLSSRFFSIFFSANFLFSFNKHYPFLQNIFSSSTNLRINVQFRTWELGSKDMEKQRENWEIFLFPHYGSNVGSTQSRRRLSLVKLGSWKPLQFVPTCWKAMSKSDVVLFLELSFKSLCYCITILSHGPWRSYQQ